jgi:hypothetical protein
MRRGVVASKRWAIAGSTLPLAATATGCAFMSRRHRGAFRAEDQCLLLARDLRPDGDPTSSGVALPYCIYCKPFRYSSHDE